MVLLFVGQQDYTCGHPSLYLVEVVRAEFLPRQNTHYDRVESHLEVEFTLLGVFILYGKSWYLLLGVNLLIHYGQTCIEILGIHKK